MHYSYIFPIKICIQIYKLNDKINNTIQHMYNIIGLYKLNNYVHTRKSSFLDQIFQKML